MYGEASKKYKLINNLFSDLFLCTASTSINSYYGKLRSTRWNLSFLSSLCT